MPFMNPKRMPTIYHPQGKTIHVIASFKSSGEIKPLYFKVEDDYQENYTFELSRSQLKKENNYIMTFNCEYIAYGRKNNIILILDLTKKLWSIG